MNRARAFLGGAIALYFVIGLEILIMISPFAAFFYAAFNPFLLALAQHPSTRWLTAFFLPHMVLPPGFFLKAVRVAGSILFVAGAVIFFVCAGQVYYNKFLRKGIALRGLYSYIRHPQYLGLGLAGLGLSILWPRFLVVALWTVMVALYFILARDEQRRMLGQFGEKYREYMFKTGMFLPRAVESSLARITPPGHPVAAAAIGFTLLASFTIAGAFFLRSYTISRLPLWRSGPVTALAILPDDRAKLDHRMSDVLEKPDIKARLASSAGPFLVYFMPKDYIMQGMIADTGGRWKLYKQHHTLLMITDWIFHPFRHLEGGHAMMHHDMGHVMDGHDAGGGVIRRMIFLRVETSTGGTDPGDIFGINTRRVPLFVVDADIHNLVIMDIEDLPAETGWGRVPTPIF